MDRGFTERHKDILYPFPCHVWCAIGFDHFPPLATATPRPCSRAAPGYTTFSPRCVIFHLSSFTSTSHFTWPPTALLNSPQAARILHRHHPWKLHLTSKLSHPTAHLQFSMNTLKIILVPVRNCPVFTCLGPKTVSEKDGPNNRGLISVTDHLALLKNASQIFTLFTLRAGPNMCPRG